MAAVKHMRGVKLLIKVGDGATPTENFTALCTVNADRGISFAATTNDQNIPDCDDPDLVSWLGREKVALSGDITGGGMLNTPDVPDTFEYLKSPDTRNIQVHLADVAGADGGGYWQGAYHLTQFDIKGTRGEKVTADLQFVSDGEVTWTDAA